MCKWEDITGDLPEAPVNAFAVDPRNPSILYAGTDLGAYVSFESGNYWSILGEGLPLVVVNDMKIIDSTYTLVAGTHGRSMYKLNLEEVTGIQKSRVNKLSPEEFVLNQNYPNPFNPETTIPYSLPVSSHIDLTIYDILGQRMTTLVSEEKQQGEYRAHWDAGNYSSGLYIYRLQYTFNGKNFSQSKRMLLIR